MRDRLDSFWAKDATKTVLASLASIVIGLLVGCVVILVVGYTSDNLSGKSAWEGVRIVLASIFSTGRSEGALTFGFNPVSTGNMLFRATPLIMTGLSVAVAFKTGLFNIGAPGQYLMGTMASLMIALGIPSDVVPPAIIWLLAFLGGAAAGAIWGCIPGLVKAYLNINEVLASIMTNWIAANAVTWAFEVSNFKNVVENTKTNYIYKTSFNGVATSKMGLDQLFPGSQVNGGIIIAIVIAVLMYILINKTTLGYQLKACGSNRHAARYAGIKDKRNIVLSMAIAGALSGAGAALYYLSGNTEFYWQTYQSLPATGFNGIPVALLASSNPIGTIFSSLFISYIQVGGETLQPNYAKEIIDINHVDRFLFNLAPFVVIIASVLAFGCIPFAKGLHVIDFNVGIFFLIAVSSIGIVGILLAGWASNNKYSLIGAMRSGAQMISYELSIGLSILTVVVFTGSMQLSTIVEGQADGWLLFKGHIPACIAFIVYIIAGTAETNRGPFDLPEADSELTAGYHTEYSGMHFGFFYLAEYLNMFVVASVASTLFLGGWMPLHVPGWESFNQIMDYIPSIFWFFGKTAVVIFIIMWFKWTFPRLRIDQLLRLEWRYLLPINLINLFLMVIIVVFKLHF